MVLRWALPRVATELVDEKRGVSSVGLPFRLTVWLLTSKLSRRAVVNGEGEPALELV